MDERQHVIEYLEMCLPYIEKRIDFAIALREAFQAHGYRTMMERLIRMLRDADGKE
jgi:hypothetical protein